MSVFSLLRRPEIPPHPVVEFKVPNPRSELVQAIRMLHIDLRNKNYWVAGGAGRAVYLGQELHPKSDIDIFCVDAHAQRAMRQHILENIEGNVAGNEENKQGTITIRKSIGKFPFCKPFKFQIIGSWFPTSARDLITGFDYTICQFVTDGSYMLATPLGINDTLGRILRPIEGPRSYRAHRFIRFVNQGFEPVDGLFERVALKGLERSLYPGMTFEYEY